MSPLIITHIIAVAAATLALCPTKAWADGRLIEEYSSVGAPDSVLIVPEGVVSIGEGAYAGSAFRRVALPSTLDSIGPYAFAHCTSLESVYLPPALRHIAKGAFSGCTALKSVNFPSSLTSIGDKAFQSTALETADMSLCGGLTSVGNWAFASCSRLTSVRLPEGTLTGEGAFMACTSLKSVEAPSAPLFPPYIFAGSAILPLQDLLSDSKATVIGEYALSGNRTESIALPSTLISLREHAMERMYGLRHIDATGLDHVPLTGSEVWYAVDCPNVELTVDPAMTEEFASAPQWQEFHISRTTASPEAMQDRDIAIAVDGSTLTASIADGLIKSIELIGIDGIILSSASPNAPQCSVNLPDDGQRAYILIVSPADARPKSFTFVK